MPHIPALESDLQKRWLAIMLAFAAFGVAVLLVFSLYEPATIDGLIVYAPPARGHAEHVETDDAAPLPPAGGVHSPLWQNCGVYSAPIGAAHAVHTLEHGAIWITVQPDLPADQLDRLQWLVRREPFLLLSPYPAQRSPIVLTAWGVQLELTDAADSRLRQFINRYRLGPMVPERGAACNNGIGEPLR